jgi:pSer/pThr/pTyr-binding forkhead associated (FHA) protein
MENAATELMSAASVAKPEPTVVLAEAPPPASARIILSDGNQLDLVGVVRIGRAPSYAPGGADSELVTVASPNQDISRTHVQIASSEGNVLVTDLRSTNGTILVRPGKNMARERLAPGEAIPVPLGSLLELGDGVSVLIEPPH